jgi:hypothetical protein
MIMIITHIRYTVKAEYAAQNKEHISRVMEELQALGRTDIRYSVFVEDDGKTFNHWPRYATAEARNVFGALESFKAFQAALAGSHPEVPPTVTNLTLVGSSYDLFE